MSCPFRSSAFHAATESPDDTLPSSQPPQQCQPQNKLKRIPTGKARVRLLYEEYIHLPQLRDVWNSPITSSPLLEPCFAAAFHSIELSFLLLSEFISDPRLYISKRPRIESVADDVVQQCRLLVEVIDGELEEDDTQTSRLTLTQGFPFPGAPPVTTAPSHSPGLARLTDSIQASLPTMSLPERNSLVKLVLNLSTAFSTFQRWSVGLGIEPQMQELRNIVGVSPPSTTMTMTTTTSFPLQYYLDYQALVRPDVVLSTLTSEQYVYHEDFFFRTVHLGTECWAFVGLSRLESSLVWAKGAKWNVAAARILQAARIFEYLGSHILLLTSMNLRDYLLLKVELEGTSGEGSSQVKSFRSAVEKLLEPVLDALLSDHSKGCKENDFAQKIMDVYNAPDVGENRQLYNYIKSLETVESALLGGFYFKHFRLAETVIGSRGKGTMQRAVQGLKSTYERPVFAILDQARTALGEKMDGQMEHAKGRMMQHIIAKYLGVVEDGNDGGKGPPFTIKAATTTATTTATTATTAAATNGGQLSASTSEESILQRLYTPTLTRDHDYNTHTLPPPCSLQFLDHAWGMIPPQALSSALQDINRLYSMGNLAWDELFASIIPSAAAHIRRLLLGDDGDDASSDIAIHFGHNSHELVTRVLSGYLAIPHSSTSSCAFPPSPFRILTSDSEFYSIIRQINRWQESKAVKIHVVSAEPVATFPERCIAAAAAAAATSTPFDAAYVSHITSITQQTLIPDVEYFVNTLSPFLTTPLLLIDGYHSFCALPTPFAHSSPTNTAFHKKCLYIGGLIKHAGAGANCAFITTPSSFPFRRPENTGWLADPSVLGPKSSGITLHNSSSTTACSTTTRVDYFPGLELFGGTPSLFLPLILFNNIQEQHWKPLGIDVSMIHRHVISLQHQFLQKLSALSTSKAKCQGSEGGICEETLVNNGHDTTPGQQSHTLCFSQSDSKQAAAIVKYMKDLHGILIDNRDKYVRIGLGAYHTGAGVEVLVKAVESSWTERTLSLSL